MGSKNISIPEDVYEKLREERRTDESFGEAIDRLLGRRQLLEFWGAWDDETTERARGFRLHWWNRALRSASTTA